MPELPSAGARETFRKKLGLGPKDILLVHVGRFARQKNHTGLLRVFERISKVQPTAHLLLIGTGPELPKIKALQTRLNLEHSVHFLGPREDTSQLLAQSDIFLFPSLNEGFGMAALEANAAGLCVVGSEIPGLAAAVCQNETAVLHEVGDLDGMAQSVLDLIQDSKRRNQMGLAGRARAEKYSIESSYRQFLEIYCQALDRVPKVRRSTRARMFSAN